MAERLQATGLAVWSRLPRIVRRNLIHWGAPSFTVGVMAVIEADETGDVLLVRQSYRGHWGLPGGLIKRGESAIHAIHREVREETGLEVMIDGEPRVRVDPRARLVDVIFKARAVSPESDAAPSSPEILETRWFPPGALNDLQGEARRALSCWGVLR